MLPCGNDQRLRTTWWMILWAPCKRQCACGHIVDNNHNWALHVNSWYQSSARNIQFYLLGIRTATMVVRYRLSSTLTAFGVDVKDAWFADHLPRRLSALQSSCINTVMAVLFLLRYTILYKSLNLSPTLGIPLHARVETQKGGTKTSPTNSYCPIEKLFT